jgi:murein L,D-transpeptidase YcbB/YkuD
MGIAFVKMIATMKHFIFYTLICCSFFISCKGQNGQSSDSSDTKDEKKRNISARDVSITRANAYNDLFLDSSAVAQFIAQKKLPDSIARRMTSFYNARNYQYAWFASNGLTEQARGFWNLHDYATTYENEKALADKALQKRMDALIAEENLSVNPSDKSFVNTELTLTQHFIQYMLSTYQKGIVKRKEMERFIPLKKRDALELADSILTKKHKDNHYYEEANASYKALKEQLARYYPIAKNGGWPMITASAKSFKRGSASPAVTQLKRYLQITGDMPKGDTSQVFDDTLLIGIKNIQQRFGYTPNGVLSDGLIKEMNVPALVRVQQILMNMERMRWMTIEPKSNLIVVNIPEFVLHVYEGNQKAFDMNVVVGKEGHNTTIFNGDLNQIVFSPYWNVPPSIVRKEILPKLASNPGYLESQHMEQVGTEDGLPKIRQLPGEWNSLGRVKFLFPNSFNIYFHDTNAKSLFSKDKRAYSHGCIRLSEPEKMAQYLLRNQPEWTPDRIEAAMDSGNEQTVRLKNPVPVIITYYTAWVNDQGQLNFREDIYGHDSTLTRKMFFPGNGQVAAR